MRIVSTAPFLTETVAKFGLIESLVGVSWGCDIPAEVRKIPKVTSPHPSGNVSPTGLFERVLAESQLSVQALAAVQPECILLSSRLLRDSPSELDAFRVRLEAEVNVPLRLGNFHPLSLDETFADFGRLGRLLQCSDQGVALTHRIRSQLLDWCSNFNARMRNRRAVCIGGLQPVSFLGRWVTDMVRLCSGATLVPRNTDLLHELDPDALRQFRPDLILVAVPGTAPPDALKVLSNFRFWDDLPAVKRGEVMFVKNPEVFHRPGPRLLEAAAALVSSMAAIDPGYIGEKDSYVTLRWLELHGRRS